MAAVRILEDSSIKSTLLDLKSIFPIMKARFLIIWSVTVLLVLEILDFEGVRCFVLVKDFVQ
jgi:hypothetical protein